jgi:hypothetical protein
LPLADGNIETVAALPCRGGLGAKGGMSSKLDLHRPPDHDALLPQPDSRHRNDSFGCGEKKPKGKSRRGE